MIVPELTERAFSWKKSVVFGFDPIGFIMHHDT